MTGAESSPRPRAVALEAHARKTRAAASSFTNSRVRVRVSSMLGRGKSRRRGGFIHKNRSAAGLNSRIRKAHGASTEVKGLIRGHGIILIRKWQLVAHILALDIMLRQWGPILRLSLKWRQSSQFLPRGSCHFVERSASMIL